MKHTRPSKYFLKELKMKKGFCISCKYQIIVVNLKIMFLKIFAMTMAFFIISLVLELFNKMGLLKGRTYLYKCWHKKIVKCPWLKIKLSQVRF